MNSGTYRITIGERFYYGSSERLKARKASHILDLKKGSHRNKIIQRAYDKYHEFHFEVIGRYPKEDILTEEQKLIDAYISHPKCMNFSSNAFSSFQCENIRKATAKRNKEKIWSDEERMKISKANKGSRRSLEYRSERSKKYKGTGNPNCKLDSEKLELIKKMTADGVTQSEMAEFFGVDRSTIQRTQKRLLIPINRGRWTPLKRKSIMEARNRNPHGMKRDQSGEKNSRAKLNRIEVMMIHAQKGKKTPVELSREFSVTPEAIRAIFSGRNWSSVLSANR